MNPRFDSIPLLSNPEYVRPPEEAYEIDDDPEYRRHQTVNNLISSRLRNRLTGAGDGQETVYGIDPTEQFFAGLVASQYPYREAQHDDDIYQNIASDVAPFSIGLRFRLDDDIGDDVDITFEPDAKIYYRRFPSSEEQLEHGAVENASESVQVEETQRPETRTDGGQTLSGNQSLVGVYERLNPSFPSIDIPAAELRTASENGDVIEKSIDEPFVMARQRFEDDNRAFRDPAEDSSIRDREDVTPEQREDEESFEEHLDEVFADQLKETYWQATLRVRPILRPDDGVISLTAKLVNTHGEEFDREDEYDEEWQAFLFDASVSVSVPEPLFEPFESEEIQDEYQYDGDIYALGENCAVDRERMFEPTSISTSTVPVHEQPKYHSREAVSAPFSELADGDMESVLEDIETEMLRAQDQYNEVKADVLEGKSEAAREDFEATLAAFEEERDRFLEGKRLIADDEDVRRAFQALNKTFDQMGEKFTEWRLFQVIFIVMSLPDIVAQADPSRGVQDRLDLCDVIYFPTGGGKTEAYLGLVVFTAFYDRLRGKSVGTTAWTKFPLRLLSLQQLQRIANVLCQAEDIRRDDPAFGGAKFSVGYFVGKNNTPNKVVEDNDGTTNNAKKAKEDAQKQEDWLIVPECPYCGEDSVEVTGDLDRIRIIHQCTNEDCPEVERQDGSTAELPVYITDEEIYRYAPTFVVSTIDKIAIMGMQRRARTLFGRMKNYCPDHGYTGENDCLCDDYNYPDEIACDSESLESVDPVDPPSLFIQDELHLLREEFGAFDSHYETFLQEWMDEVNDGGWNPKYVAATATIAGAEDQVQSLYWRDASIFPSQGPRLKQSFYAYEDPHQLGRQMVGAIPRSVSRTYAINATIKEYARVLQEYRADLDAFHEDLLSVDDTSGPLDFPSDDSDRREVLRNLLEQYETQISYNISKSNSDLLQRSVKTMINRQLKAQGDPYEILSSVSLTGETPMSDVRDALERLEADDPENPIDVVIATSMISHGVDVDKFNFISFFGMPRNTAEYIQAYSRVGRQHTGTVFVLFNPMRARDRSHYSRFDRYHRYQDLLVEATPLERWAEFAVECTLPGIFAGLVIQYYDELLEDEYDDRVYMHDGFEAAVRGDDIDRQEMLDMVLRCYAVTDDHKREWADTTGMRLYREKIESQFDELWKRTMKPPLNPKKGWIGFLLDRDEDDRGPMRSLRDIDEQIPIYPTPGSAGVMDYLTDN